MAIALLLASGHSARASVLSGHARLVTGSGSQFRSDAMSRAVSGDPSANLQLSPASNQACSADQLSAACDDAVLADINAARASEGVGPMTLPGGYYSLTTPQQLLVLANLERTGRGMIPALGLSAGLNAIAASAAAADADPNPGHTNGDAFSANWAGGTPSPLLADFMWMYDDGLGSGNIDCTVSNPSGCWGHRDDILFPFDAPLVMGAAYDPSTVDGPSLTELFVGGDTATSAGQADAPLAPTWAAISRSTQLSVSTRSLVLSHGAGSGQLVVSAPGVDMYVTAAVTSGGSTWQVSPASCALAAGSSCVLTVTGQFGKTGTLTVYGPGGSQSVALSSQAPTALRMNVGRSTVTGQLAASGGAGVAGQRVTLYKRAGGSTSVVSSARTNAGGSVRFHVSSRGGTQYSLVFAGSSTLAPASTGPAVAHGSRRPRRHGARRRHASRH